MSIIIVRHSKALSRQEANVCYDADRPLSEAGQEQARRLGRFLQHQGLRPDPIICSPFVRTEECAALIAGELDAEISPTPVTMLVPGSGPDELLRAAMDHGGVADRWLLAVLHEPDIGHILGALLLEDKPWPLAVHAGDLFALEVHCDHGRSRGELVLYYSPSRFPD